MTRRGGLGSCWRTSSQSGGGECVEARVVDDQVQVRDSKDPNGPSLAFDRAAWRALLAHLPALNVRHETSDTHPAASPAVIGSADRVAGQS
jgi:hypothetical protein